MNEWMNKLFSRYFLRKNPDLESQTWLGYQYPCNCEILAQFLWKSVLVKIWKYLLKYVDILALYLEPSSEELKIPSHREAYSCLVERGKTLKQSDIILVEVEVSVAQSCPNSAI